MIRPTPNSPTDPPTGPSTQLTIEAVVASYIHAISDRHQREDQTAKASPDQARCD